MLSDVFSVSCMSLLLHNSTLKQQEYFFFGHLEADVHNKVDNTHTFAILSCYTLQLTIPLPIYIQKTLNNFLIHLEFRSW